MPFSDNLYSSLGDSDDDDFADLSPSDGYFASSSSHAVPSIPNVIVSDPTLQRQEQREADEAAEAKAQEAIDERVTLERSRIPGTGIGTGNHGPLAPAPAPSIDTSTTTHHHHSATSTPASIAHTQEQERESSHTVYTYSQTSSSSTRHHPPALAHPYPIQQRPASLYSDAPPAYTPSPTSPLSSADARDQPRDYNTFSSNGTPNTTANIDTPFVINMGNPDLERERLLPRAPESMLAPVGDSTARASWIKRFIPAWLNPKNMVMLLLLLALAVGFLITPLKASTHKNKMPGNGGGELGSGDGRPETQRPTEGTPPFVPKLCHSAKYHTSSYSVGLDFKKIKSVSFRQKYHDAPGSKHVQVGGELTVRRSPDVSSPRIEFDVATNDESVEIEISLVRPNHSMTISVPEMVYPAVPNQRPCIEIKGTIWLPGGVVIDNFDVDVVHLDVSLLNDLSIHAKGSTNIKTVAGDVVSGSTEISSSSTGFEIYGSRNPGTAIASYQLDSRVISVSTISGDVTGSWPLYDELSIHTTSGDIKTSVSPREELESDPKPALLKVGSQSGTINVLEPVGKDDRDGVPHRDYQVDMHSTSSTVSGTLAFSSKASFQSISGKLDLDLLPVLDRGTFTPHAPSHLNTETTSGNTDIRLLEPVWYGSSSSSSTPSPSGNGQWQDIDTTPYQPVGTDDPYGIIMPHDDDERTSTHSQAKYSSKSRSTATSLDCLDSIHHTTSGNLQLRYPDSWVGKLSAETTSGKLKVHGHDVYILKSSGWLGSKIEAGKGPRDNVEAGSTIEANPRFGNLDILIGED